MKPLILVFAHLTAGKQTRAHTGKHKGGQYLLQHPQRLRSQQVEVIRKVHDGGHAADTHHNQPQRNKALAAFEFLHPLLKFAGTARPLGAGILCALRDSDRLISFGGSKRPLGR